MNERYWFSLHLTDEDSWQVSQNRVRTKRTKGTKTNKGEKMAVKSETKGVTLNELDALFEVTEEKKQNMAAFKGKRRIELPEVGDKNGLVIRPLWSKDDSGNPVPIIIVKSDSPKMKSPDGTMKLMTVEEESSPGEEVTIAYGSSLHYGFVGLTQSRGWKFEDIYGKWFKIVAEEYDNSKAPSGRAIRYRPIYREDLNTNVVGKGRSASSQFD